MALSSGIELIVIAGPTAVGKSAAGVALARALDGEIISGDSVQVYRELNIGAAKPPPAERLGVPHHLLDELDLAEPFTAASFCRRAATLAAEIRARGRMPIVVGGTGLYLRALLDGFTFATAGADREGDDRAALRPDPEALHRQLSAIDPVSAARLHPHDTARLLRALEVFTLTGRPLSAQRRYEERLYPPLPGVTIFGLTAPRPWLYERINARAEVMLRDGLFEETAALLRAGRSPELKPLRSIGYRHAVAYLRGLCTQAETLRLLQRDTRRLAKRQWTWFCRDPRIIWLDVTESPPGALVARMTSLLSGPL
ncbi:MAG: tRNA (adenosine(37)-N6)-dimethylallyltransferase MiaA [Gracilibacteraceae bacterium]|jgi:tRNA dimethylallyltransferase|nr:tRNA (adenosine(37)-N6)-dimethylallyltransferase MiaA [Gracilibacteraceae bacterium]